MHLRFVDPIHIRGVILDISHISRAVRHWSYLRLVSYIGNSNEFVIVGFNGASD